MDYIGSFIWGRKSLETLKKEVMAREDIPEDKKKSLMDYIGVIDKAKDELLAEIAKPWYQMEPHKWRKDQVQEVEELQTLRSQEDQLRKEKEKLAGKNEKLAGENEKLEKEKEKLEEEKGKLEEEKDQLRKEKEKLAGKNEKLEKEKDQLRKEKEKLAGENGGLQEQIKKLEKGKEKLAGENEKLEEEKEKLEEEKEKLEEEKDQLRKEKEKLAGKNGGLQEQIKKLEKEKEKLAGENEKLEKEKENLVGENERLQKEKDELQVELKWKWIHKYADDITLNADTAHPNISIHQDMKSFTHEAQTQRVKQNPERFDSTVCVLGSEGFSSGKHYWEVEVKNSTDWDVGLARKSIQRKGKLSLSPNEGFWVLGLNAREYWAKTDPWTRVMVKKKPKKIGVYLSYEDKDVTIFNVSDMSLLFTFNNCSFSGEVYPFFKNFHKETSMRICSIRENE